MESPLSAIIANIYLKHYESICLAQAPSNIKPVYYKRYMDGTFFLFSHTSSLPFSKFSKSTTSNIKFAKEEESENSLPFLNILIKNIQL